MYDSVMIRAVQKSNELELSNLKLVKMDATYIEEVFDKEISRIYLNFSDPWPKDRHAKRRLTSNRFLERYDKNFKGTPNIIMKTDNVDLFNFSLESLKEYGYDIEYSTNDLYSEDISDNVATEYEKKFVERGVKINKLVASKKS
jgi:tRNA (guanine-N7-)-methyltransferase